MSEQSEQVEAQAQQRDNAHKATRELLMGKAPASDSFDAPLGPNGQMLTFSFRSIGSKRYDALLTQHPPTAEQRAEDATFNADTFGPALLSKVCVDPALNEADWGEIWKSDNWNRGEIATLFWRAVDLCNKQVPITPTVAD